MSNISPLTLKKFIVNHLVLSIEVELLKEIKQKSPLKIRKMTLLTSNIWWKFEPIAPKCVFCFWDDFKATGIALYRPETCISFFFLFFLLFACVVQLANTFTFSDRTFTFELIYMQHLRAFYKLQYWYSYSINMRHKYWDSSDIFYKFMFDVHPINTGRIISKSCNTCM